MDLFLELMKTISEIGRFVKTVRDMNGHKQFYSYLKAYFVVLHNYVGGENSSTGRSDEIIQQILARFESIISPDLSGVPSSSPHLGLRALIYRWQIMQDQDENDRLEFVKYIFNFELDSDQHYEFIDELGSYVEILTKQDLDYPPEWEIDDFVPQRRRLKNPSYAMWNAAQSLFKALMSAKNCNGHKTHDLGAILCLGTYRTPGLEGDFDFDMFLALESHRQETHIQTVKDSLLQFAVNSEITSPQGKRMRVRELCESIKRVRTMTSKRLKLKVEGGQLWKLQSETSRLQIDELRDPVTLQEFIKKRPECLNEKTKRILAILLSYTVLHFYGTPWLQRTWGSSSILFFYTKSSTIPLRPYMDTQLVHDLPCEETDHKPSDSDDVDEDGFDPDDFDPDEPLPHELQSLVTLAAMLMELFYAMPFTTLAKKHGFDLPDKGDHQISWINASLVFEACNSEMNSQFRYAVEKCLDPQTWRDNQGCMLDTPNLRIKIFEEIVSPLEDELQHAFGNISVENLDNITQTLDFGCWGRTIQNQQAPHLNYPSLQNADLCLLSVTEHSHYSQYESLSQECRQHPKSTASSEVTQMVTETAEHDIPLKSLDKRNTNQRLFESVLKDQATETSTVVLCEAAASRQGNTFSNYDDSNQFNAPQSTQSNNTGGGNQFSGAKFNGPVYFGKHGL